MLCFRWKLHKNWKTFKVSRWQNFKPNIKQNVIYLKIWGKITVKSWRAALSATEDLWVAKTQDLMMEFPFGFPAFRLQIFDSAAS